VDVQVTTDTQFKVKLSLRYKGKIVAYVIIQVVFFREVPPKLTFSLEKTVEWNNKGLKDFKWAWIITPSKEYVYFLKEPIDTRRIHTLAEDITTPRFLGKYTQVELGNLIDANTWVNWLRCSWKELADVYTDVDPLFQKTSLIVYFPANLEIVDPTTVGTGISRGTWYTGRMRKTFYANGRFWVFWSDGFNIVYATSTDGLTWTSPTTIRPCKRGDLFTVWFDGTYMHYVAIASFEWNQPLYYRRGTPNPDGTITWSAPEQIAVPASATERYLTPCIAVDSDTYPFISYHKAVDTDADGLVDEGYTTVTKSSKNDGTWLTASGFPYTLYYDTSYHRKGDNKIGAIWVWISAEVYYVRHEFIEINLYAHLETVTIADIAYYLLKIISADATGLDLSVDGGTVGRKLFGKFVYPLTTVKKILASTWKVFYRTWTSKRVEWHCDIDILIRKADGTIRTAIASDVANSPLLVGVTTPTTVSGTYTFAEYNVVDQTDYLEIDFYATVEVRAVGQTVYLRIDDKALPIADQVRIEDVAWTEYFVEYPPPPPPVVVPRIVGDTLTWVIG